ncbi:hypothetical protein DW094_11455 [Ruminococcaceae bacterium AM07-15]|nr:hypothetical protein DW094_11455 [Ruminococcaceae bacterium AM07-15]
MYDRVREHRLAVRTPDPGCNPGRVPQKRPVACRAAKTPPLCKGGWRLAPPGGLPQALNKKPPTREAFLALA